MSHIATLRFDHREDYQRWQDFIHSRHDTHCADLAQWRLLFRELYGFKNYTFAYCENEQIQGAVSLYHIRSPFMGNMLLTCPFFGYGGFFADNVNIQGALLQKIEALGHRLKVDFIELRLQQRLPAPYKINTDFLEFDLKLLKTTRQVWEQQLSSNARQNIRKSDKHQLQFSISSDYHQCYNLLSRTLRAHGTPFHSIHFFQLLKKYFRDNVCFSQVRYKNKLVASGIVIKFKQKIITPYIGSLKKYRQLEPNYCQYWGLIKYSLQQQLKCFELGRSPKDSTHAKFKQKWGAEKVQVYYNHRLINPAGKYRSVSKPAKHFLIAVNIWRRLPLFLTRTVGPWVFRYIP